MKRLPRKTACLAAAGTLLLAVIGVGPGCASDKNARSAAARQQPPQPNTNYFSSSVEREAAKSTPTNAAPAVAADNTAQNKAEAKSDTVTPFDQGNSERDLAVTQSIRRAVVSGEGGRSFSFSAKNCKIITVNGEVTLRGVVASEQEKQAIGVIAEKTPRVKKVYNQLEIKGAPPR